LGAICGDETSIGAMMTCVFGISDAQAQQDPVARLTLRFLPLLCSTPPLKPEAPVHVSRAIARESTRPRGMRLSAV
jgi:hypothetical protein